MLRGGIRLCILLVAACLFAACASDPPKTPAQQDDFAVEQWTDGKISPDGVKWLDRLALDLNGPETDTATANLRRSCAVMEEWHKTDRHPKVNEDLIILARICNRSLHDDDWSGAQRALAAAH